MKALKSPLAKRVLADPKARGQLRAFIGSSLFGGKPTDATRIEVHTAGKTILYQPVVVPKA
ncbi:MAG: hypothetical protein ABI277_10420 [Burkholderiaceae bacterium]